MESPTILVLVLLKSTTEVKPLPVVTEEARNIDSVDVGLVVEVLDIIDSEGDDDSVEPIRF